MTNRQDDVFDAADLAPAVRDGAASDQVRSAEAMLAETECLIERADELGHEVRRPAEPDNVPRVSILGLPLARVDYSQTLRLVDRLIERGRPAFFITANLHYAMLTDRDPRLRALNDRAAFIVADGMPMVWCSWLGRRPLPERVAGSELIHALSERAAQRGYRVFLLGGASGVGQLAAENLRRRYPGLKIVGIEWPMLGDLSDEQHAQLIDRVRRSRPDLLLVAFGQPKGELWLAENCGALGVPACVQLGASFDFVAGRVQRAPKWMQRAGLEWLYRVWGEPKRMIPRYWADAIFLAKAMLRKAAWRRRLAGVLARRAKRG